jgi:hypothetical protein
MISDEKSDDYQANKAFEVLYKKFSGFLFGSMCKHLKLKGVLLDLRSVIHHLSFQKILEYMVKISNLKMLIKNMGLNIII